MQHVKIKHKGEKDFQCHYCEKMFTKSTNLTDHIIAEHEPDRKFKCPQCERKFVKKHSNLRNTGNFHNPQNNNNAI